MRTSYIFMITRSANPDYLWGAAVAASSLRRFSSREIHFLVTPLVDAEARRFLAQFGNGVIEKPLIEPPSMENARFRENYTKLHIFNLAEFDRIVYLDADVLPLQSLDELFEVSAPLAAVPDPSRGISNYFNAGVLSLRPDAGLFQQLMEAFRRNPRDWGCAEQDFLNWWFGPRPRRLLPARLNLLLRRLGVRNWQALAYGFNAVHLAERIAAGFDPANVRLVHEKLWEQHGLPEFELRWREAKAELVRTLESRGACAYQAPPRAQGEPGQLQPAPA